MSLEGEMARLGAVDFHVIYDTNPSRNMLFFAVQDGAYTLLGSANVSSQQYREVYSRAAFKHLSYSTDLDVGPYQSFVVTDGLGRLQPATATTADGSVYQTTAS